MTRLKENHVKVQKCANGNNQYIYKVIIPCKLVSRHKLKKGDVFIWDDSTGEISIRLVNKR